MTSSPPVLRRGRSVGQRSGRPPLESQPTVSGVSPAPSPHRAAAVAAGRESPISRATSLDTRSRSPSPHAGVPSAASAAVEYYGTAKLTDRSRSPSPTPSLPVELERRPRPRLPPQKPTALDLPQPGRRRVGGALEDRMPHVLPSPTVPPPPHRSPGSINFPRLSPSPSHAPWDPASPTASPGSSPLLARSASSQLIGHTHTGEVGGAWAGHGAARQQRYPSQQALPLRPQPRYHPSQRPLRADELGLVHLSTGTGTLPHPFRAEPSAVGGAGAVPRPSHWAARDTAPSPRDVDELDDEKNSESDEEDWC